MYHGAVILRLVLSSCLLLLLSLRLVDFPKRSPSPSLDGGPDLFYQPLDKSKWTMLDIRKAALSYKRELAGMGGTLRLPEEAMVEIKPSAVNRSTNSDILIYNRVPKCGSSTMEGVLRALSRRNNFTIHFSQNYGGQVLSPTKEEELAKQVTKMGENGPVIFDRHFFTMENDRHHEHNFEWINIVREPVSRLVSMFHYLRKPARWASKKNRPPESWFNKSLDACVLQGDKECQVGFGFQSLQLSFFCGSNRQCVDPSSRSGLQMAKYNIETRYAVVGVMEEFQTSLEVLQEILPRWFRGAVKTKKGKAHRNSNSYEKPSNDTLRELEKRLALDIELYLFAKQRLLNVHESIKR